MDRFEAAAAKLAELNEKKQARDDQACMIGGFLFELRERDEALTEFDPYIWAITLDAVTANSDGSLVFKFRNGLEANPCPPTPPLMRFRERRFSHQRDVPLPWAAYPQQLCGSTLFFRLPAYQKTV